MPIKKQIEIDRLLINEQNPRFSSVNSQKLAIKIMLQKMESKIKKLAEDIAKNGLNPAKPLLVKKKNSEKYTVLEGNRRLISILLIGNPNIVSLEESNKQFFKKLQKKYKNHPIKKINCVIFSEQELDEANHWIKLEHTGQNKGVGQVPWDSGQIDRFQSQNSKSNKAHFQIIEFMKKHDISLKENQSTNIARIINTKGVKEKIGIKFKNGKMSLIKNKKDVINNLKKIAKEVNKPKFHVEDIYSAKKIAKWIDKTLKENPTTKIITRRKGKDIKEREIPTDRLTLIPEDFTLRIAQSKIHLIYEELKELKIDTYRNAVAVLFRVFLELSVKHYINKEQLENGQTLFKKIKNIADHMERKNILTTDELKSTRVATSKENRHSVFSTETFNDYVHNVDYIPTSQDLKISWDNMQKFFEKLWK